MWSVVIIASDGAACDSIADALSEVDRRLRPRLARDVPEALAVLGPDRPELAVVADPQSPPRSLEAVRMLRQCLPRVPVLVEVPGDHPLVAYQALGLGAADCLKAPVAPWEWQERCRSLLDAGRHRRLILRALQRTARARCRRESETVHTGELLSVLARANVFRDAVTGRHERRTGQLARLTAEALGMEPEACRLIEAGAGLHDIGKVGIPDEVLLKPGRYTADDHEVMRGHPEIGHSILIEGKSPTLRLSAEIALCHHERVDGSGYPRGLAGVSIPLPGRIVAVADVLDALTGERGYRRNLPLEEGMEYLKRRSGVAFDADCVEALASRQEAVSAVIGDR